jgi:hypothetical protein
MDATIVHGRSSSRLGSGATAQRCGHPNHRSEAGPSLHSFSIRDLFLVTLVVALPAGWFVDNRQAAKRETPGQKQ